MLWIRRLKKDESGEYEYQTLLRSGLEDTEEAFLGSSLRGKGWALSDPAPIVVHELSLDEKREAEYSKRGITLEKLVVALWEAQMEPSQEHTQVLQVIQDERAAVKILLPK